MVDSTTVQRQMLADLSAAAFVFDRDLRLVVVEAGDDLLVNGYDPSVVVGSLVQEVVPAAAFELLEGPYRAALGGVSSDFDYVSPIGGVPYRVRVRPATAADGAIIGGVAISVDASATHTLRVQLAHARGLIDIGSAVYERRSGWVCDDDLLRLWGQESVRDPTDFAERVVLPGEREQAAAAWQAVLARGGEGVIDYRMRNPVTGQLRDIHSVVSVTLDGDGHLIRAQATHIDVTDLTAAHAAREQTIAAAAAERAALLNDVGDLLASPSRDIADIAQKTAQLACVALGDSCVLRILTADRHTVETVVVADREEGARRRLLAMTDRESRKTRQLPPVVRDVVRHGHVDRAEAEEPEMNGPWKTDDRVHRLAAPMRSEGGVVGVLSLYRRVPGTPYDANDGEFVQLLADRLGVTIDGRRTRERMAREEQARRAVDDQLRELTSDQRDLVLQLDRTESRERARLADVLHDEPLQTIAASMLRLDLILGTLPEASGQAVGEIAEMLSGAVEQLRNVVVTLTPPDMGAGLRAALEQLAAVTFVGTTTAVSVSGPEHVRLEPKAKETVYRIVREALMNVRKHAHADAVVIQIRERGNSVHIQLSDNGVGTADLHSAPGHHGLVSMRARAAAARTRIEMTSRVGEGTTVRLEIPMGVTVASGNASASSVTGPSGSGGPSDDQRR